MINLKKLSTLVGWGVFIFSSIVYLLTMEDNVSFWDCGEFISGSYKLQIVHPPGAPAFLMIGRIFTLFAGSNLELVPVTINALSALSSALTIAFLFWSVVMIAKKFVVKNGEEPSMADTIVIIGSALVAAVSATFADSFWFSAVEGEVYALSFCFSFMVFWAILKWETISDEPYADRWLILIAFIIGFSSGVHLLSLLALPAITFVYYFKKYEVTKIGIIKAFAIMAGILFTILNIIIMGMPGVMAGMDKIFVNSFGLPFNSGMYFTILAMVGAIIYGIYYAIKKNNEVLYKGLIAFSMVLVGYSSYVMVPIRANAEPAINMSKPADPYSLSSYLRREQYGDRPLLYGPIYTAQRTGIKDDGYKYYKGEEKYEIAGKKRVPEYSDKDKMFFPRIYSQQDKHIKAYRSWLDLKETDKPTFADNMRFFFKYQVGYMYVRYFMWNFVGRQNDRQGLMGSLKDGNWISGISFIDNIRLPSQDNLPSSIKDDKSRNTFFFLPLILGLIGLVYMYQKNKKVFSVVTLLFLFTGILILVVESNEPPIEPRERDYAVAGSFIAFAIWIGFSVLAIYEWLKTKKLSGMVSASTAIAICFIAAPVLMGFQGWDDHDRSIRKVARDFAVNYLESCAPNAILFTQGDNDTYPLWYAQEVEGIRTDVRIINTSLLAVDWYIDKLKLKMNDADAVPMTLTKDKYLGSRREYVLYYDNKKVPQNRYYDLSEIMKFVSSDKKQTKVQVSGGEFMDYFPTKMLSLPVDKQKVVDNGTVPKDLADKIVPEINWKINKGGLLRNDLVLLDILAANNWERPIHFAISVSPSVYLGLQDYFQLYGLTYRLVPVKSNVDKRQPGLIYTPTMYDNLMNKFRFGEMDKDGVFLDEGILRMTYNLRNNYARLAGELLAEGEKQKAISVLDKCMNAMPKKNVPYNVYVTTFPRLYYQADAPEKGKPVLEDLVAVAEDDLNYYMNLPTDDIETYQREIQESMAILQEMLRIAQQYQETELATEISSKFEAFKAKAEQF